MRRFKDISRKHLLIMPIWLVAILAFSSWASTSAGQEAPDELTSVLRYSDRLPESYDPGSINLADEPPEKSWMLPKARGSRRLYGSLTIGEDTQIKVVLDVVDEKESLMRFAFDKDIDFRDKKDVANDAPVTLKIRYMDEVQETYSLRFYYLPSSSQEIGKKTLNYYCSSSRAGSLKIGGKSRRLLVSDSNSDGKFSDLTDIRLRVDLNGDQVATPDESFNAQAPFPLDGIYYSVVRISASGDQVTIRKAAQGRIQGVIVRGDGQPVSEATVGLLGLSMRTNSDPLGTFNLEVPAGRFGFLVVHASGYVPRYEPMRESVSAEHPLSVKIVMQPVSKQLSGELLLGNGHSYHVLARTYYDLIGGDFYVSMADNSVKFYANNLFQRGLTDLGDLGDVDIDDVAIPEPRIWGRLGIEAITGHIYVSLAKAGEEGNFIVFRVKDVIPGKSIKIDYRYRKGPRIDSE